MNNHESKTWNEGLGTFHRVWFQFFQNGNAALYNMPASHAQIGFSPSPAG